MEPYNQEKQSFDDLDRTSWPFCNYPNIITFISYGYVQAIETHDFVTLTISQAFSTHLT